MDSDKKEFGKWWIWVLLFVVISIIVLSFLNYAGMIGRTVVERKVFEQSYQRSESYKSQIATWEAQLIEINSKLSGDLDKSTRQNLEAQASSIRVMLNSARRMQ